MTDTMNKSQNTIADYLGDVVAVETHIEEALDRQLKVAKDDAIAGPLVQEFHDMVKRQRDTVKALQDKKGTTAGNPVIAAGSSILGKIAGMIDMVRTEAISKALRDDYVAFNLAAMSYSMFLTTAKALGDHEMAALAEKHLTSYAAAIQKINHSIAGVVISELVKDGHQVEAKVTGDVNQVIDSAWKRTAPAS
jgi:ferritin-like metal-binding protein YciE